MLIKLKHLAREPLLHFLLIGTAIYFLFMFYSNGEETDTERTVTVTSGQIQSFTDQWTRLWNRPPSSDELDGLVLDYTRTRILYLEALSMGLDEGDTVIERRMAQRLELLAQGIVRPAEPAEDILRIWFADNIELFNGPDLYTVTQVFFDPDKREQATFEDAQRTLEELQALDQPPGNYSAYGDRFLLENYYPSRSELELRKLFGSGFVDQILTLQPGIWHGTILSGFGVHLVLINSVQRAPAPEYEDFEEQVRERWMVEQITELSENFLDSLISRYEIVVEETADPITVPAGSAPQ